MTPAPFHLESEVLQRAEELSLELGRQINGFDVFLDSAKLVTSETREWTYIKKMVRNILFNWQ
jgi:hypothetical protein